jgi:hypothetical protein
MIPLSLARATIVAAGVGVVVNPIVVVVSLLLLQIIIVCLQNWPIQNTLKILGRAKAKLRTGVPEVTPNP